MATLAEIGNKVDCGVNVLGTGTEAINSCQPFLEAVSALWFTKKGFIFDPSEEFNLAYIQALQQEKKLFVVNGVLELTPNKEENPKETDELGRMAVIRKGLYSYTVKFRNGLENVKALNSLNSLGALDISFVDNKSPKANVLGTVSTTNSLKGFSTQLVDFNGVTIGNNSARMSQELMFQLKDSDELEQNNYFISGKELDFDPKDVDGVNDVIISVTTPVNLATTIVFDAKLKNGRIGVSGLALADLLVTKNGSSIIPTAIAESGTIAGRYTLTVSALATNDVVTVALFDSGNKTAIIFEGSVLQSNTDSVVAI